MRRILIVTLLLLTAALPLTAQSISGTVTGTVRDEQGGVLPGVNVTLAGKAGRPLDGDRRGGQLPLRRGRPRHLHGHRRALRLPLEATGQRGRHRSAG